MSVAVTTVGNQISMRNGLSSAQTCWSLVDAMRRMFTVAGPAICTSVVSEFGERQGPAAGHIMLKVFPVLGFNRRHLDEHCSDHHVRPTCKQAIGHPEVEFTEEGPGQAVWRAR